MSDSEETTFASADEGDDNSKKVDKKAKSKKNDDGLQPSAPAAHKQKKVQHNSDGNIDARTVKGKVIQNQKRSTQEQKVKSGKKNSESVAAAAKESRPLVKLKESGEDNRLKDADDELDSLHKNQIKKTDVNDSDKQEVAAEMKTILPEKDNLDVSDATETGIGMLLSSTTCENGSEKNTENKSKSPESTTIKSSGWGWRGWSSPLLGAAATSVITFTSHVEEGVHTIMETVETGLGVVSPEEIAKSSQAEKIAPLQDDGENGEDYKFKPAEPERGGWWSGWGVSNITDMVQNTGKTLVSSSLGALETIGKKTFDVIAENDKLRKTKVLFERGESSNLSSLLQEAKGEAELKDEILRETEDAMKSDFKALFEEYKGEAHMDALQLLSSQSERKVYAILSALPQEAKDAIKPELLQLRKIFEIDITEEVEDDREFAKLITDHLSEVHLGTQPDKVNRCQKRIRQWFGDVEKQISSNNTGENVDSKEVHRTAIQSMAELTSKVIEQFHKSAELILLQKDLEKSFFDRSNNLASLTEVVWTEINIMSAKFSRCLNMVDASNAKDESNKDLLNHFVTSVYLEASNSCSYIQDGFQLMLPIMQQAFLQNSVLKK